MPSQDIMAIIKYARSIALHKQRQKSGSYLAIRAAEKRAYGPAVTPEQQAAAAQAVAALGMGSAPGMAPVAAPAVLGKPPASDAAKDFWPNLVATWNANPELQTAAYGAAAGGLLGALGSSTRRKPKYLSDTLLGAAAGGGLGYLGHHIFSPSAAPASPTATGGDSQNNLATANAAQQHLRTLGVSEDNLKQIEAVRQQLTDKQISPEEANRQIAALTQNADMRLGPINWGKAVGRGFGSGDLGEGLGRFDPIGAKNVLGYGGGANAAMTGLGALAGNRVGRLLTNPLRTEEARQHFIKALNRINATPTARDEAFQASKLPENLKDVWPTMVRDNAVDANNPLKFEMKNKWFGAPKYRATFGLPNGKPFAGIDSHAVGEIYNQAAQKGYVPKPGWRTQVARGGTAAASLLPLVLREFLPANRGGSGYRYGNNAIKDLVDTAAPSQ